MANASFIECPQCLTFVEAADFVRHSVSCIAVKMETDPGAQMAASGTTSTRSSTSTMDRPAAGSRRKAVVARLAAPERAAMMNLITDVLLENLGNVGDPDLSKLDLFLRLDPTTTVEYVSLAATVLRKVGSFLLTENAASEFSGGARYPAAPGVVDPLGDQRYVAMRLARIPNSVTHWTRELGK